MAAGPEKSIRDYLRKTHYKNKKASLILEEDRKIPFAHARFFRARDFTGARGWTVLAGDAGRITEANTNGLRLFLKSIEWGLVKMRFEKKGEIEATRISNALLNHLGPSNRSVQCRSENERSLCELSFTEGQLVGEKVLLLFDFKGGFILVKK